MLKLSPITTSARNLLYFCFTFLSMILSNNLKAQTVTNLFTIDNEFVYSEFTSNQFAVPTNPSSSTLAVGVWQVHDPVKIESSIYFTVYNTNWTPAAQVPKTNYINVGSNILLKPQISTDIFGNVVLAWLDPARNLLSANLPAGETTWSDPVQIASQVELFFLSSAQASQNPLFGVAYSTFTEVGKTLSVVDSTFGGSWSAPSVVTAFEGVFGYIHLAINNTDNATGFSVAWEQLATNTGVSSVGVALSPSDSPFNWNIRNNLTPIQEAEAMGGGNLYPQTIIDFDNTSIVTWLTRTEGKYGVTAFYFNGDEWQGNPITPTPLNLPATNMQYMKPGMQINFASPKIEAEVFCVQATESNNYSLLYLVISINNKGNLVINTQNLPQSSELFAYPANVAPAKPFITDDASQLYVFWQTFTNAISTDQSQYSYQIATATAPAGSGFAPITIVSNLSAGQQFLPQFGVNANGDIFAIWLADRKSSKIHFSEVFGYASNSNRRKFLNAETGKSQE